MKREVIITDIRKFLVGILFLFAAMSANAAGRRCSIDENVCPNGKHLHCIQYGWCGTLCQDSCDTNPQPPRATENEQFNGAAFPSKGLGCLLPWLGDDSLANAAAAKDADTKAARTCQPGTFTRLTDYEYHPGNGVPPPFCPAILPVVVAVAQYKCLKN